MHPDDPFGKVKALITDMISKIEELIANGCSNKERQHFQSARVLDVIGRVPHGVQRLPVT